MCMDYNVHASTALWVLDYLTNRPQFVKITDNVKSDVIFTNTAAPQGTILSPFLFSVYTADCWSSHSDCVLVKYADDMALMALITDDDDTHCRQEIESSVQWCGRNYLDLHVGKTKEMIVDFRWKISRPEPAQVVLRGDTVERVETYKYLGVLFDSALSWKQNTNAVLRKVHTWSLLFSEIEIFQCEQKLLQMFYSSVLSSILTFGLLAWGGNACKWDEEVLDKIIRKASGVVGRTQDNLDTLYDRQVTNKLNDILHDITHPLRQELRHLTDCA